MRQRVLATAKVERFRSWPDAYAARDERKTAVRAIVGDRAMLLIPYKRTMAIRAQKFRVVWDHCVDLDLPTTGRLLRG